MRIRLVKSTCLPYTDSKHICAKKSNLLVTRLPDGVSMLLVDLRNITRELSCLAF